MSYICGAILDCLKLCGKLKIEDLNKLTKGKLVSWVYPKNYFFNAHVEIPPSLNPVATLLLRMK